MAISFMRDMETCYGKSQQVTPLLRRVLAPNPSIFTFYGTGSLIVGKGEVALVDPGPDDETHIAALLSALGQEKLTHILVTHTHADHSAGARTLSRKTGAPILGFGLHPATEDHEAAEEGGDFDLRLDAQLKEGDLIRGPGWTLEALYTPGHIANHLCFSLREDKALLCGDHVMGWSTSIISPPEGHMGDYMHHLKRLLERDEVLFVPTHGPEIQNPRPFVEALLEHRHAREKQIIRALQSGVDNICDIVAQLYTATPAHLHAAAARSVLAHLIYLVERGIATCDGAPTLQSQFRLC